MLSNERDHFHAVHVGHVQVEHHQVDRLYREPFDSFETTARLGRLNPAQGAQRRDHHAPHRGRIVNHQDIVYFDFV
ncbi:MAG TPA: hypothetical protein VLB87_03800 [Pyrinomonadaceae bacterium]|nr:hypothetical protein [Pyrinomonadaceae bacterium]